MAVLIDRNTRLIVQGLTGREGTFHAKQAAALNQQALRSLARFQARVQAGEPIVRIAAASRVQKLARETPSALRRPGLDSRRVSLRARNGMWPSASAQSSRRRETPSSCTRKLA